MTTPAIPAFPDGFLWGVSSSAYQIEGAVDADGRGRSTWDTFCARPDTVLGGDTGAVATDHYHRYREDVALMAELGVDAYRFSVSWPRVLPSGWGAVNQAGLDFYDRLVDELCAAGIAPAVTLFHWDTPQVLEDAGGWLARDTAHRFADYATVVADRLADRVRMWMPLNEPMVLTLFGYAVGAHAPGWQLMFEALPVAHHQLLGHGLATQALRAAGAHDIGIANHHVPVWAASEAEADQGAARTYDALVNDLFAAPVLLGEYPGEEFAAAMPGPVEDDLKVISTPLDWYGVNYYQPSRVGAPRPATAAAVIDGVSMPDGLPFEFPAVDGYPVTDFGWPVVPDGLREVLTTLTARYGKALPPVHVTENGCSYGDGPDADGRIVDSRRIDYLDGHVRAARRAIDDGVDLRGYFVWSIVDNFEWAAGVLPAVRPRARGLRDARPHPQGLLPLVPRADPRPAMTVVPTEPTERVPARWTALFSLAGLGLFTAFYGPIQVLLGRQAQLLDPSDKEFALGLVVGLGAAVSMVANPLFGALSDRTTWRAGRRLPWTAIGAAGGAASLVVLSLAPNLAVMALGWCLAQLSLNAMFAALVAAVPDQVPHRQRGAVGGWFGAGQTLGIVLGSGLAAAVGGLAAGYLVCAGFLLVATVPYLLLRRDTVVSEVPAFGWRGFWISPRLHPDFGWAWLTRFLMNLGNAIAIVYLLYFLQDAVGHPDPDGGVFVLTAIYAVTLLSTVVVAGVWSDRVGRRRVFVSWAGCVMAAAAVLLAVWPTWPGALVAAAVLGLGFGVYTSVDFALMTEVLPAAADRGKDLGVVNVANALPQVLAPVLAAPIVTHLGGYPILYTLAAAVGLAGAGLVYRIRSVT